MWAQFTVQVIRASPKKPFSCCKWTALLLILKQPLCWWFGNEQTEHWLCLPSLEVDASKQAKNWVSSQSHTTHVQRTHWGTTCSSAVGTSAALQGLPQLTSKDLVVNSPTHRQQQHGAARSRRIHSRGSNLWVGAFLHLSYWVTEVQKDFYPKYLKLTWTHTSSPDSTDAKESWGSA